MSKNLSFIGEEIKEELIKDNRIGRRSLEAFLEIIEKYMPIIKNALEELQKYRTIGTVEECREAVEKQKEMKAYCDENDCVGCPYHNVQLKENRCMNDFIADEIMKGG